MSMSTTIKSIQDIMRKDVGVDGDAQRIGQLVWLLFLKIWDDREQELALLEDDFASPLVNVSWTESGEKQSAGDLRWSAWAADPEGITGDKLLGFVDDTLFPALKGMEVGPRREGRSPKAKAVQALRRRRRLVKGVFEDAYQYMKSGTLLRQVVNKIQTDIDFNDATGRHLFGDLYEQILKDLQGAGNAGEYYTPRAVTQFAVDMIDPRLGESILDPACGTGGFLACAIEHVRRQDVQTPGQEAQLQASIRGVEKKPLPHLLCATNMIVHGIDVPAGIVHDNTLSRPLRDLTLRDRVDVVLTNPPFGGMEEDGIENNFPVEFRTRETADLFLVLIVELLKPGGRAAVVLPDGTLFGEGVKTRLKERLLTECNLHTIVACPTACSRPTRASGPTCCSSTKAGRRRRSGTTSTPTPRVTSPIPRPSRCASRNSLRRRRGGTTAWRTSSRGRSASTGFGSAASTWTSRTPTRRGRPTKIPTNCWQGSRRNGTRQRPCGSSFAKPCRKRWNARHDPPRLHREFRHDRGGAERHRAATGVRAPACGAGPTCPTKSGRRTGKSAH